MGNGTVSYVHEGDSLDQVMSQVPSNSAAQRGLLAGI